MKNTVSTYTLSVKENISKIQAILNCVIVALVVASFAYFMFWIGAISDKVFLELGEPYFEPFASFLNPNDFSVDIYKFTSFKLFFSIVPIFFMQFILSKLEEALIYEHNYRQEMNRRKEQLREIKNFAARFDSLKTYAICLSIDYEAKKNISASSKEKLNNIIFSKLSSSLKRAESSIKVVSSDVLIIASSNFDSYDGVYDKLLSELASLQKVIENKYNYKMTPSITTDAFYDSEISTSKFSKTNIRRQHFQIQSFNFKNRALTTAIFAKKYRHIEMNKYAGIPIGEYVYFNREKTQTYELNVIHKNLAKTLAQTKA